MSTWGTVELREAASIINGGTPKTGVEAYWDGGVPWLTPAEMGRRTSPFITETRRTLSEAGLHNSSAKVIPPKSIILSTRAPIGHLAINEVPMAFNQGCRGIVPKSAFDTKFLFYFLQGNREVLDSLGVGTTFKELSATNLGRMEVASPPLAEQRRIVAILDEALEGIATATANAEKNLANARELVAVHVRATFAKPDAGWTVNALTSICQNLDSRRVPVTKKDRIPGGVPYYGASGAVDYVHEYLFDEELLLVSEDGANLLMRTYPIAFSISGKSWVNNHAHVLRFPDTVTQRIVEYYLNSISLAPFVTGMAQPKLNQAALNQIPVPLPPASERERIVGVLDSVFEHGARLVVHYSRKLLLLNELKQSILHRAFNGELTPAEALAA